MKLFNGYVGVLLLQLTLSTALPTLPSDTSTSTLSSTKASRPALPGFVGQETFLIPTPTTSEEGRMSIFLGNPPPYTPIVTAAPDEDAVLESQGFYMTTYYRCKTVDGREDESCGWRAQVVEMTGDGNGGSVGVWAVGVGVAAMGFAMGLA